LIIGSFVGALVYLKFKVPVYSVQATIIIKDEHKGLDNAQIIQSLNAFSSKEIVENEIEVIKSKTLAQEVARNLYLYAPVYEERSTADRSAYTTSPIHIVVRNPDSLQGVGHVPFNYNSGKQLVIINNKAYPLNKWTKSEYGELKFVPNSKYRAESKSGPMYFSLVPLAYIASDIAEGLDVAASNKLSSVVNIIWTDEVPERGKDILNELISAYNRAAIADKNKLAANTLAFVEERLRYVTHDLDSIEAGLQNFRTQNNIVDIDVQGKQFLENVGENDQKIEDINMQLSSLDQIENYVLGKGGTGGIVPSTFGISAPELSNL